MAKKVKQTWSLTNLKKTLEELINDDLKKKTI
jgi:hypothetical protein